MRAGVGYLCTPGLEANRARIISKPLIIRVMFSISTLWSTVQFVSKHRINWDISKWYFPPISGTTVTIVCGEVGVGESINVIMYVKLKTSNNWRPNLLHQTYIIQNKSTTVDYLDQQLNNIHVNNEFVYRTYCYMFRCIWIICTESYFLLAKIAKSVRL